MTPAERAVVEQAVDELNRGRECGAQWDRTNRSSYAQVDAAAFAAVVQLQTLLSLATDEPEPRS